jgi:FkbM family methyltransferase
VRIIYDFGSNNGDDIPYYLKKADKVVAVEANPSLCAQIRLRFEQEIAERRLIVESCVLTTGSSAADVAFYVHKSNDVLSQFPEPGPTEIEDFDKIILPARSVLDVIAEHGAPYYVKIDIEHYDEQVLRALFENKVRPPFVSAEVHSVGVFAAMVSLGGYDSFKLVDGQSVSTKYRDHSIATSAGNEAYSFPFHSAGPFGEDIDGEWMSANDFFRFLAAEGLGWKDVHATNQVRAQPSTQIQLVDYAAQSVSIEDARSALRDVAQSTLREVAQEVIQEAARVAVKREMKARSLKGRLKAARGALLGGRY